MENKDGRESVLELQLDTQLKQDEVAESERATDEIAALKARLEELQRGREEAASREEEITRRAAALQARLEELQRGREEAASREEEITRRAGKTTPFEYVNGPLPGTVVVPKGKSTGRYEVDLADVQLWDGVLEKVRDFQSGQDNEHHVVPPRSQPSTLLGSSEMAMQVNFFMDALDGNNTILAMDHAAVVWRSVTHGPVMVASPTTGVAPSTTADAEQVTTKATALPMERPPKKLCRRVPDFCLTNIDGDTCLVSLEMKHPSVLGYVPEDTATCASSSIASKPTNEAPDLVEMWAQNKTDQDHTGLAANVSDCISQLYAQMCFNACWFGVLSTYKHTWLVKRNKNNHRQLLVSPALADSQTGPTSATVRGAMAFVASEAEKLLDDSDPLKDEEAKDEGPKDEEPRDSQESSTSRSESDSSYKANVRPDPTASRAITRSQSGGANDAALPDLLTLPLPSLHLGALLGEGACGPVYTGRAGGRSAAIKLMPTAGWVPEQGYLWEACIYKKLQKLQGNVVPEFIGHGYTSQLQQYWLALSVIHGTTLAKQQERHPRSPFSPALKSAAVAALGAVHALGVLHGDIRLENIMVLDQKDTTSRDQAQPQSHGGAAAQPQVVILDFEQSHTGAVSKVQFDKEKEELARLLG